MLRRTEKLKTELIEDIINAGYAKIERAKMQEIEFFIRSFYSNIAADDILEERAETLFMAALSLWEFGEQRSTHKPKIRAYSPNYEKDGWDAPYSVIEIVNDDMPFLVDSVTAALNRESININLVIHPVVSLYRDNNIRKIKGNNTIVESYMQIRISEQNLPEKLKAIETLLEKILWDVRRAVEDWQNMRHKNKECREEIEKYCKNLSSQDSQEVNNFLMWLDENHFTYLGYRDYQCQDAKTKVHVNLKSGLGILRDPLFPIYKNQYQNPEETLEATFLINSSEFLLVTKADIRATVHRSSYLDVISIKKVDSNGHIIGLRQFVGLFTSVAYNQNSKLIPFLRSKVNYVLKRANFASNSHDGKALLHILETYPRDELFQASQDELYDIAMGILYLQERQRIALFVRRDLLDRFASCFVYVPRDRYDLYLAQRVQDILVSAFGGHVVAFYTHMTESTLCRIHIIVTLSDDKKEIDLDDVEKKLIEAGRSWVDRLKNVLIESYGDIKASSYIEQFSNSFPTSYKEKFTAQTAIVDIAYMEIAIKDNDIALNLYKSMEAGENYLGLKLYNAGTQIVLSDVLPMLENMGLKIESELFYEISPQGLGKKVWVHDFVVNSSAIKDLDIRKVREIFHEAFKKVWSEEMENDGFNRLTLSARLNWRQVTMLRAYCKYLRQITIPFSQSYMEETLAGYSALTIKLVELFESLFDPQKQDLRTKLLPEDIKNQIVKQLDTVSNLDQDRILRRYLNVINATLRTNYYQKTSDGYYKSYVSFKLNSSAIDELPLPHPMVEVFVYSPRVEAIHLRGGKVARGGVRWSDRREDFRTEILGLMKAQMVKNSVIVPVGSKGGFIVKKPPLTNDRNAYIAEGIECYKIMVRGLLDITDNLSAEKVHPPVQVIRHDDDDPYLVVAADKGTATFSDIANSLSRNYGFWLDDAFASGGSAGYDHKKMGITAKGVWETVKRHFREMGRDIQSQDFTCIGVGDMSGDVFGNGMLLSKHTRLLAAFNHLHIFIDPNPDAEKSWKERERLFNLPGSSWTDYQQDLISAGGGIFDRKAKSIKLTPEIKLFLGVDVDQLTPNAIIKILLCHSVDLLFFGGIGTYIKASSETHGEVGDKANDFVRVDSLNLQCKVIGEGANLGITQNGRIEFALKGGKINTDALDNSAGVDCSDHEVNIKILLNKIVRSGQMTLEQRDHLLASMTDEVAQLVLRDNYLQSQALSIVHSLGYHQLDQQSRFIKNLEKLGKLDRALEFLPSDEVIKQRRANQQGLTRPELAVLLAYAKMTLYAELLPSDLPDEPQLTEDLINYFPKVLGDLYDKEIMQHQLKREIIATAVTNSLVNRVGPTFVFVMNERTGMSAPDIARAYAMTRTVFELRKLWASIESLDNKIETSKQIEMFNTINVLAETATIWFLKHELHSLDVTEHIASYGVGVKYLSSHLMELLQEKDKQLLLEKIEQASSYGISDELNYSIQSLAFLAPSLDIVRISQITSKPVHLVAKIYFLMGEYFSLDWLRQAADNINKDNHWDRMAVTAILDDFNSHQNELTIAFLNRNLDLNKEDMLQAIKDWVQSSQSFIIRTENLLSEMRQAKTPFDLARLAVANRQIRSFIENHIHMRHE
ncbi:MAG: NAD-glutamate dehydrogenase [Alphaproteobacteria bacterium]|nr:NAD-glutamate dehydrogenase [Alphaproteobacteria bacterium]